MYTKYLTYVTPVLSIYIIIIRLTTHQKNFPSIFVSFSFVHDCIVKKLDENEQKSLTIIVSMQVRSTWKFKSSGDEHCYTSTHRHKLLLTWTDTRTFLQLVSDTWTFCVCDCARFVPYRKLEKHYLRFVRFSTTLPFISCSLNLDAMCWMD